MKNIYYIEESDSESENVICSRFRVEDVGVKLYSYLPQGSLYIGTVPDNPSINRISQVVERRSRGTAKENGCRKEVFLHVMEAYREESCITAVHMGLEKQEAVVTIEERERVREIRFAAD